MNKVIPLKFRGKRGFRGKDGLRERGGNLEFGEVWSAKFGGSGFFTDYFNWMKSIMDIIYPPSPIQFNGWNSNWGSQITFHSRLFDNRSI